MTTDEREREERMQAYIEAHIDAEPPYLQRLYRATQVHILNPRMASGHAEGRLLKMLTRMIRPRIAVEIGTYTGYSSLCIAEGLDEGALLHTYEVNDELEDFTRGWIEGSPLAPRIVLHIGDAVELMPQIGSPIELAFIDGDKRSYCHYYRAVMQQLAPGGYILADNTLWDGHVTDPAYDRDEQTQGIRRFNDMVAADPQVERVVVPIRDGLTIIRKRN